MKLFTAFLLCLLALPLYGQTGYTTVSSQHLTDSTGTVITNATIQFSPVAANGTPIAYQVNGNGQATFAPVQTQITGGIFSLRLADTNLTKPQNVCYAVTVTDNASGNTLLGSLGYTCVQPAWATYWCVAGACNWDLYQPNLPSLALIQTGPTGATGPAGNNAGSSGPASPAILYPTDCGHAGGPGWCSGTDPCQYMAAAIAALPSTGGIIDGSGFSGPQVCTANPFSTAASNGVLRLGSASYQTTAQWVIPSAYSWRMDGVGRKSESGSPNTTIQAAASFPANTPVVRLGSGTTAYGQAVSNLTIDCNSRPGTTGIYSTDIQEQSGVEHVSILNCPNRGIWMNGSGSDGTGPFFAQNYSIDDLYVLPLTAATTSTIACEFDGDFTSFHKLSGATCGGSTTAIADDFVFDKIFAGTATNLNAESASVGYLLGNANAVTSLTITGMQSANITGTVVSLKAGDSSVFLTGIVNGGGAAPQTLLDPAHLGPALTDFSIGMYAIGTGNSTNGFTPVVSTSPYVGNLLPTLSLNNGADAPNTLSIHSGATTSQISGVTLYDRGVSRWSFSKTAGNQFQIFDNFDNFQSMNVEPGGNLDFRSQGTGAVNFNENPGSGTSGVQFFSGGATPVPVAAISGAGVFLSGGGTITIRTGAPSTTCGTSPNGSGSLWLRTDGAISTTLYICAGTTWSAVTVP